MEGQHYKWKKKQLIQLLENYAAMINESGVLLLDYYCINYLRFYYQNLKWSFKRYNKRQTIVDCFGETSTYYYLVNLYGKQTIDMLLIPLSIKEQIPYLPLSKIMDTAYISANDLNKLIEITKNTPKWRFAFAKCKNHIKAILLSLCSRLRYFYSWFFFLILDCIFMFNIIAA